MKICKKFLASIISAATIMMLGTITCYADNWGDLATVAIDSSDGWTDHFHGPFDYKETDSSNFHVLATAKTMTSSPSVRLINYNSEVRSSAVSVSSTYVDYTGNNNTGTAGYVYWTQTKPAWNQVGTDSIRYQIKAD